MFMVRLADITACCIYSSVKLKLISAGEQRRVRSLSSTFFRIKKLGIQCVFGLVGVYALWIEDALYVDSAMRWIGCCH